MVVQKSDAMLQHEKWIAEVVSKRPKRTKETHMLPEPIKLIVAGGIIVVILLIASALMM